MSPSVEERGGGVVDVAYAQVKNVAQQTAGQLPLTLSRPIKTIFMLDCSALSNPKGKKQGVAELRKIVGAILIKLYPKQIKPILKQFGLKP